MEKTELYRDIAERTQGDIYIGVVGPVRTGKSTFIKRFMELLVLPGVENEHVRARILDELPQSANGKTIMTTQPKFVPNEAAQLALDDHTGCRVRLIDCVGYMVPGASGHLENDLPRMVRTPWFDEDIPFEEAAQVGTEKVMSEHSTIGIVMTTDGTITELPRESYAEAEARVVADMKRTGKPFIIVINSIDPYGERAQALRGELENQYGVSTISLNVLQMSERDAKELIRQILMEFPISLVEIRLPSYMRALPQDHPLLSRVMLPVLSAMPKLKKVRDYAMLLDELAAIEQFQPARVETVCLDKGVARLVLQPEDALFY